MPTPPPLPPEPPAEPPAATPSGPSEEPPAPLPDGEYDAFIVWVDKRDDTLVFEVTLTTGPDKGALYSVAAAISTEADPVALVGLPCTLSVRDSRPRVRL